MMSTIYEKTKALPMQTKVLSGFLIVAIVAFLVNWYFPDEVLTKQFTEVKQISSVAAIPKVSKAVTSVKVIPKAIAIKKIKSIPDSVKENPNEEIVDTADLPASENGTQTVTILDVSTGDIRTLAKEKDAPLFAFEKKLRFGVGYGVSTVGGTQAKIFSEISFLRIGNVHAGLQAEVNASATRQPEAKAMAVLDYRP